METVYSNPTEAAKGIRAELKAAFPGIKFSVRTSYFSMGNSIDITWSFGPTYDAVDAIVGKYQYGRFDSSTDSSSCEDTLVSMPGGDVKVLGGAKFVQTHRNFVTGKDWKSDSAFRERVGRDLCALNDIPFEDMRTHIFGDSWNHHWEVGNVVNRLLAKTDLSKGYGGVHEVDLKERTWEDAVEVLTAAEGAAKAMIDLTLLSAVGGAQ